jgi:hypothetical protein
MSTEHEPLAEWWLNASLDEGAIGQVDMARAAPALARLIESERKKARDEIEAELHRAGIDRVKGITADGWERGMSFPFEDCIPPELKSHINPIGGYTSKPKLHHIIQVGVAKRGVKEGRMVTDADVDLDPTDVQSEGSEK